MTTLLVAVHILVCLVLIGIVLLQGGKGAELGSAFGGGASQTLFGPRGASTFLGKMTTVVAVVFMVTSLLLTIISFKRGSVVEETVIPEKTTVPVPSEGVTPQGGVKEVPQTPETKEK